MLALFLLFSQILIRLLECFIRRKSIWKRGLHICSVGLLVVWTVQLGVNDFLDLNIGILIIAFLLSYILYLVSLSIVGTKFYMENLMPFKCFHFKGRLLTAFRRESIRNIFSSTYEEFLYRWFLQNVLYTLTHNAGISIITTVIVFFAVHIQKNIAIVQMIDIFVFSLVITLWFYFNINPIYSIMIHIVRNQLIICQKYVAIQSEYERKVKYLEILQKRKIK